MTTYKNYSKILVGAFVFLLLTWSCSKNTGNIPYVPVSIQINLQNPDYASIKTIGGSVSITGGSKGIIVYRQDISVFKAYDRHCPYNPSATCSRVTANSSSMTATDTCCGSQFQLFDGSVLKGPATRALLQYQTSFDGNILSITN